MYNRRTVLDCQDGIPPSLDDGVGCTTDECDELNDQVIHTTEDSLCNNGLFCDGIEYCDAVLDCQSGAIIDCSGNDLSEIATCNNNPDNVQYTWDYAAAFNSICDENTDSCTTGTYSFTHTCDTTSCGADPECDGLEPGQGACDQNCQYNICAGTAKECSACDKTECENQEGCAWEPAECDGNAPAECDGNAQSCNSLSTQTSCQSQDGCTWEVQGVNECTGKLNPWQSSCSDFKRRQCGSNTDCAIHDCTYKGEPCYKAGGCTWTTQTQICTGTETECNNYNNENLCEQQQGCYWNPEECDGTSTQCISYLNEPSCTSQLYCSWERAPECNLDHTDETGKCNEYCNADPECDGVSPGTNDCNNNCQYISPEECYGSVQSCSSFNSQTPCQSQDGCTWEVQGVNECTGELNPWQSSCSDFKRRQCGSNTDCAIHDCTYKGEPCYKADL